MNKTKLTICIEDEEYQKRFVKCVMKHYKESYEIHIVDDVFELLKNMGELDGVIITGDGDWFEKYSFTKQNKVIFVLQEEEREEEHLQKEIYFIEKYQEIYKMMEQVEEKTLRDLVTKKSFTDYKKNQWIGIFSLQYEIFQIPFTALLAEILGERTKVLVVDIQPYSGFSAEIEEASNSFSMEDLMTVTTTGIYTENRIISNIGHEQKWDYVYPMKNVQCFTETDAVQYRKMISLLQKERGYEQVILNFGAIFPDMIDLMNSCDSIYLLTGNKEERSWREKEFITKIDLYSKDEIFQKFIWMEIPASNIRGKTWRMLVKEWLWDKLGDELRAINWMENGNE